MLQKDRNLSTHNNTGQRKTKMTEFEITEIVLSLKTRKSVNRTTIRGTKHGFKHANMALNTQIAPTLHTDNAQ